ncbi:MAG: PTS sugar transporter subunit IIA [Amaricoccus sp.]
MELSEIIGVDAVRAPLRATSKKRLLQDLADMAEQVYRLPPPAVYKALMDRETLGPTGVGRGVAIPHARFAGVPRVTGLFTRLEKPVDFEAIDRQPVDLVFALFAPESAGAEHLKALARVSRTLRSDAVCAKLRSTFDPSALYAILTDVRPGDPANGAPGTRTQPTPGQPAARGPAPLR